MLSPLGLHAIIDGLLRARQRSLASRPIDEIVASLDSVVSCFLDPSSLERQEAEARLPQETGFSSEMIRHTLPLLFQEYQGGKLVDLLYYEFGTYSRLDRFEPTLNGDRGVFSFPLIAQVLAG